MKTFYVYLITNTILNKQYVGSHIYYGTNPDKDTYMSSSGYVHKDIEIYGKENFVKNILAFYDDKTTMLDGETENILKYNTLSPTGYNYFLPNKNMGFHMCGREPWNKGKSMSNDFRKNCSKGQEGRVFTEEHKNNMSNSLKGKNVGKKRSKETLEKRKNLKINVGEKNGMHGKSAYSMWIVQFGKEIADQKLKQRNEKASISLKERNKNKRMIR